MNVSDRIQQARRAKGLSQEQLADAAGVSRQAVSKWESEQSAPSVEAVIALSDILDVTTDWLLKGIEPAAGPGDAHARTTSRVLYIASSALCAVGLLCAFGGWYGEKAVDAIWGSMIIQAVGVMGYFVGRVLSGERAPFAVKVLNLLLTLFIPSSLAAGAACVFVYGSVTVSPYPEGLWHFLLFAVVYAAAGALGVCLIKLRDRRR